MIRRWCALVIVILLTSATTHAQKNASPFRSVVLSAVTTGTSLPIDLTAYQTPAIYFTSVGTTSGGVLTIEEADYNPNTDAPYGGTWSAITTVNASSFTGGAQAVYHCALGTYRFLRVRVSSTITGGGTVTVAVAGS